MEIVPYGGWQKCARFTFGEAELIVTMEVGPRIIRFGFVDGPNELRENPAHMGKKGGSEYRSYGGHRLWIAPEDEERTTQPDNDPVEYEEEGGFHLFRSRIDKYHVQKEIGIKVDKKREAVILQHRIRNFGAYQIQLAPWALTVMAPGGECLFPHHPFMHHAQRVLPVGPLVLWGYTRMDDSRWTWGPDVVRLRQDASGGNQKVGAFVSQGYAAYANNGNLFFKRFGQEVGPEELEEWEYPDFGCNFETFTREDMLEVESLGPLEVVPPDPEHVIEHWETWYLLKDKTPPKDNTEAARWLANLAKSRPQLGG
jgi:hypothetical protein